MKRIACLVAIIGLLVGSAHAQEKDEVTGSEDLVKQKSSQFQELMVNPDADISKYNKLYLWNSIFQFRDVSDNKVNRTTTSMMRGDQGHFTVPPEEQEKFKKVTLSS